MTSQVFKPGRVSFIQTINLLSESMKRVPTTILYIDDDQDDLLIFEDSVNTLFPEITLFKAQSSEAGIHILHQLESEKKPYPSLIMIDMNMPKMDGRQTLQHIRSIEKWQEIPIAIFTTFADLDDIEFCKHYGSACITKPMNFVDFSKTLQILLNQITLL